MTEKKFISGEGAIFQNKYKKQDGHPDKKGSLLIPKELLKKMAENQFSIEINYQNQFTLL